MTFHIAIQGLASTGSAELSIHVCFPQVPAFGCRGRRNQGPRLLLRVQSYIYIYIYYCAGTDKRPRSFCQKCRWQFTPNYAYTLDPTKSERADYAVQAQCCNLLWKRAHTQLVKERSTTVISARFATVASRDPGGLELFARADLHLKKTTNKQISKTKKNTKKNRKKVQAGD